MQRCGRPRLPDRAPGGSRPQIYAGPKNPRTGKTGLLAALSGSELGWLSWPVPAPWNRDRLLQVLCLQRSKLGLQYTPINFDSDIDLANKPENLPVDAMDPDLGKFMARGGKLLLFNGWNDTSIPPGVAVGYYKNVLAKTGAKTVGSDMRFFMVPDMGHCPAANGPDAYNFDSLNLIVEWRENNKAPDQLVATHFKDERKWEQDLRAGIPRSQPIREAAARVTRLISHVRGSRNDLSHSDRIIPGLLAAATSCESIASIALRNADRHGRNACRGGSVFRRLPDAAERGRGLQDPARLLPDRRHAETYQRLSDQDRVWMPSAVPGPTLQLERQAAIRG